MTILKNITLVFIGLLFITIHAQEVNIKRVEPAFWWVGMEHTNLQILVHGNNISHTTPKINYKGVTITDVSTVNNPNYMFIDLNIDRNIQPGKFEIVFKSNKGETLTYTYQLFSKRTKDSSTKQTVNASDVMYLITPDRFANGKEENDSTDDTIEQVDRSDIHGRHGGDLEGIIRHLDYIRDIGVTTLWLNPFLENDQPEYSYHGYGISDFYKTDSRFGTNDDYLRLVSMAHNKDMKVIIDQVFNHCGSGHWWMEDLPSPDWLNQWEEFTKSSFTNITASDRYASNYDYDILTKGWFDKYLPDLNLENKFLATYMIQNSMWWIEYANLDGIRMDTYPYPNKQVMAQWVKRLKLEYPNLYIVAETWEKKASSLSYWNAKKSNTDGYIPYLDSASDFPSYYAMIDAFTEGGNIYRVFETLAEDFIYGDAYNNKIFNGNHDVPRLFNLLKKNKKKVKLSMALLFTTRGIPQIYYGDELLFEGDKPDGILRKDFPGGWPNDNRNLFLEQERTDDEKDLLNYIKTILNWRKGAKEIHNGKLKHFQPFENIYTYFRYTKEESTMVIINNSDKDFETYGLDRYKEALEKYTYGVNIITNETLVNLESINLKANTAYIIKLSN